MYHRPSTAGSHELPPWNRSPYPAANPNTNLNLSHAGPDHPFQPPRIPQVPHHAPMYPRSSTVPPHHIQNPDFLSAHNLIDRPFIPIEQRHEMFFERPRARTTFARSLDERPSPPPPPLPPHPIRYHTSPAAEFARPPLPMQDHSPLMKHITTIATVPPIPPKPGQSAPPALPPKPTHRPTIPLSTKPDFPPAKFMPTPAPPSPIPPKIDRPLVALIPAMDSVQPLPLPVSNKPESPIAPPAFDLLPQPANSVYNSPFRMDEEVPLISDEESKRLAKAPAVPVERPLISDEEANGLAKALAESASDSATQERLRTQEDEDLARALQQSMEIADSEQDAYGEPLAGPSTINAFPESSSSTRPASPAAARLEDSTREPDSPLAPPPGNADAQQMYSDQDFARRLIVGAEDAEETRSEEDEFGPSPDTALPSYSEALLQEVADIPSRTPSPFRAPVNEPALPPEPIPEPALPPLHRTINIPSFSYPSTAPISEPPVSSRSSSSLLPSTADIPELEPRNDGLLHPYRPDALQRPAGLQPSPPSLYRTINVPSFSYPTSSPNSEPPLSSRSPSLLPSIPDIPEPEPRDDQYWPDALQRPAGLQPASPASSPALPLVAPSQTTYERDEPSLDPTPSNPGSRQYLDPEFTMGVSIGFMNPAVTARLTPMTGIMPNIIALPYGRCPPLHIQAPNWRHMLRLMARLSNTRIEPTIEAVAATKTTLYLRTVIQFVKVPDQSWRTIFWLTIDHPVPPSAVSWKWTNGDVNTLPYSYTLLISLPPILRDGADGVNSKYYTIPSTTSIPWPSLPITLPDYANYLHEVLKESRRASHDSSGGLRRLAKMIDMFYPEVRQNDEEDDHLERSGGVSGLFKRVMGRNKARKGVNEDTYDLVTPFMMDEY